MAKEFGTVMGGTDMKVERFCWKIEQNSGGGPRNPDPGTTYCLALDFGGISKPTDATDRCRTNWTLNKLRVVTKGKVWARKERNLRDIRHR